MVSEAWDHVSGTSSMEAREKLDSNQETLVSDIQDGVEPWCYFISGDFYNSFGFSYLLGIVYLLPTGTDH